MTTRRRIVKPSCVHLEDNFEVNDLKSTIHKEKEPLLDNGCDRSLPYGGKVFLARKKKPDSWFVFTIEVLAVLIGVLLLIYIYLYYENLHFHVHHAHAHLGHSHAQHVVAQKYFQGSGVEKNYDKAFHWFRKAADNGHPHAAYNLAVAHLKGHKVKIQPGEVRQLIETAADKGLEQAKEVLDHVCTRGHCDNL